MDTEQFNWDSISCMASPTQPAAGSNFVYTVAAGKRLRIIGLTVTITTDANVANRTLNMNVQIGAGLFKWGNLVFANQTASRTNRYFLHSGQARNDSADQPNRFDSFPVAFEINPGDILQTALTNIQVGDQISITWTAKEATIA